MGLIALLMRTPAVSVALGTLPGIVALPLTPAKERPWRSLGVPVPASAAGYIIFYSLVLVAGARGFNIGDQYPLFGWLLFIVPTITGLIVAFNIDRLPMRWLHPASR